MVRAERPGLSALIPSSAFYEPVRGLAKIFPDMEIAAPVDAWFLEMMLEQSRKNAPNELLFWLKPDARPQFKPWALIIPNQECKPASCKPVDPYNVNAQQALIEVHSHVGMGSFFSEMDDRDEAGFRVYAVLGQIFKRPTIAVRVGIYGHFWNIPAAWVFELPAGIEDAMVIGSQAEVEDVGDDVNGDNVLDGLA